MQEVYYILGYGNQVERCTQLCDPRRAPEPYEEWVNTLDRKTRAIIRERINRLHLGNFGDHRRLTGDLYELRIHYGAGYRVYLGDLDGVITTWKFIASDERIL